MSPAPDDDFDGQCVHVCEVGEDGWLNVVAGPVMPEGFGSSRASIEYVSASPSGFVRRILMNLECSAWKRMGRSRRFALMEGLLMVCRSLWGDDRDLESQGYDMPHPATLADILEDARILDIHLNPVSCPTGMVLDDKLQGLIMGRYHVPELERFMLDALGAPDALLASLRDDDPEVFHELRVAYNNLLANGKYRHVARKGFVRHQWLMLFGSHHVSDARLNRIDAKIIDTDTIAELLSSGIRGYDLLVSPDIVRWLDKWVARNGLQDRHMTIGDLILIDRLPASWRPRDRTELDAFIRLSGAVLRVAGNDFDEAVGLLASSKGRYAGLGERIQGDIGPLRDLEHAIRDIRNFLDAAGRELILPTLIDETTVDDIDKLATLARRLISPGGGVRKLLRLSDNWHDVVRLKQQSRRTEAGYGPGDAWRRSVEDMTTSSGCTIVELLTEAALEEEGRSQGHCVGGYALECAFGGSHIFSIRSEGTVLSTFEVVFDDLEPTDFTIVQHQGPERRKPDKMASAALEEWVASVKSGAIEVSHRPVDKEMLGIGGMAPSLSLDEWRPFLVKPLADLSDDELTAEISRLGGILLGEDEDVDHAAVGINIS